MDYGKKTKTVAYTPFGAQTNPFNILTTLSSRGFSVDKFSSVNCMLPPFIFYFLNF
tara:strand:- start:711 stop:878 length:168 start_codon:yes stop_codon:yes gene_type:complete